MITVTARTILDAPTLPLFDAEEIRWQECKTRVAALLEAPAVAEVLTQIRALGEGQAGRIEALWLANFRLYRTEQLTISHRLGRADRDRHYDALTVKEHVWRAANRLHGQRWTIACAAQDATFAAVYSDLLDGDEARLFTKPWADVVGTK